MKHTALPWKVVSGAIDTEDNRPIAHMVRDESATKAGIYPVERDENAKFIVRACNCHEELLAELINVNQFIQDNEGWITDAGQSNESMFILTNELIQLQRKVQRALAKATK